MSRAKELEREIVRLLNKRGHHASTQARWEEYWPWGAARLKEIYPEWLVARRQEEKDMLDRIEWRGKE